MALLKLSSEYECSAWQTAVRENSQQSYGVDTSQASSKEATEGNSKERGKQRKIAGFEPTEHTTKLF